MKPSARPELPTVMDCSALLSTRPDSTYKSGKVVQTSGATSVRALYKTPLRWGFYWLLSVRSADHSSIANVTGDFRFWP